jgi:hypothetical protein
MKIEYAEEHEDGSATVKLDLEPEEHQALLSVGFEFLLRQMIQDAERSKALEEAFNEGLDRA